MDLAIKNGAFLNQPSICFFVNVYPFTGGVSFVEAGEALDSLSLPAPHRDPRFANYFLASAPQNPVTLGEFFSGHGRTC